MRCTSINLSQTYSDKRSTMHVRVQRRTLTVQINLQYTRACVCVRVSVLCRVVVYERVTRTRSGRHSSNTRARRVCSPAALLQTCDKRYSTVYYKILSTAAAGGVRSDCDDWHSSRQQCIRDQQLQLMSSSAERAAEGIGTFGTERNGRNIARSSKTVNVICAKRNSAARASRDSARLGAQSRCCCCCCYATVLLSCSECSQ